MRLGVCTSWENIETAQRLGYDFIEPPLHLIAALDENTFAQAKKKVEACKIRCEAVNMLFPHGIRLIGPERDLNAIQTYVQKAFSRAAALGGKTVVFGSGGARRCPDGFGMDDAHKQLVDVCLLLGEEAVANGLTVVIEPLNSKECNNITSVRSGLALAREAGHPGVALLADFYHMEQEAEELDILRECGSWLQHCHISYGPRRAYLTEENLPACLSFVNMLESIGYGHRLSIEGVTENFEADAAASYSCLRGGSAS